MKQTLYLTLAVLLLSSVWGFAQVAPPANLTATVTSGNHPAIALAWQYDPSITHPYFIVYKKSGSAADSTSTFQWLWSGRSLQFVDNMVHPGTYEYYVTAVVTRTESQPSNVAEATIPPPAAGRITGVVTDDGTSEPVHGIVTFISVLNSGTGPRSFATDSNGVFVAVLSPGQYIMKFNAPGYIPEYYDNVATITEATRITLNQDDSLAYTIGLAKVQPPAFGIFWGQVTDDSTGLPIFPAEVQFMGEYPTLAPIIAHADSNGYFTIRLLTSRYYVATRAMGYVHEYFDNVIDFSQATRLTLNENDSLGLTIGLAPVPQPYHGIVSGVVFDDETTAPVTNGCVQFSPAANILGDLKVVPIDSNGTFRAKLRVGQYYVKFQSRGYVSELYDNVTNLDQATVITVNKDDSLSFSIGLAKMAPEVLYTLSGTVTDAQDVPQKTTVCAYRLNWKTAFERDRRKVCTVTDSLGNYSLSLKAGDTVVLSYSPVDRTLMDEFWNDKRSFSEADRIIVSGDLTDLNVTLEAKPVYENGISGSVTDSIGLSPVEGYVCALKKVNGHMRYSKYYALTDTSTGVYLLHNMEPGTYLLLAGGKGYKSTYYRFDGIPTMDWRKADTLVVGDSSLTTEINFHLMKINRPSSNAHIAGSIMTTGSEVIDNALVYALDAEGEVAGCAMTDEDGSFEIGGLGSGEYTVVSNSVQYQTAKTSNVILTDNTDAQVDVVMTIDEVTGIVETTQQASAYKLSQNYPNPFNPATQIIYEVPVSGYVSIKVYNVLGQEVATLVNDAVPVGIHHVIFDGTNLTSGLYFVKLEANNSIISVKKMTLMK